MSTQPTVYVVDDCAEQRDSVRWLLESVSAHVETYASADEFLRDFDPQRIGCLILDIRMPGMSGLELQRALARLASRLRVIFLSGHGSVSTVVRAMRGGAVDFLEKPVDEHVLLERVQEELRNAAEEESDRRAMSGFISGVDHLSRREREVLEHLVEGKSAKEIARDLDISPRTVEVHRARILTKTGAATVTKLVAMTRRYQELNESVPTAVPVEQRI